MAIQRKAAVVGGAEPEYVSFLSLDSYSAGGFLIPAGKYALEFVCQEFQPTKNDGQSVGAARLGVMVTGYPIGDTDPETNKKNQFYSMGSKAHDSFAPSADGKRLVAKPGASGSLQGNTNWFFFLKSLLDAGLPPEVVAKNNLAELDGVWVQISHVPEPEERKDFGNRGGATGEAALMGGQQAPRKAQDIAVVSEILDGGAPWEGGGGMPEPGQAAPAAAAPAVSKVKAMPAKAKAGAAIPAEALGAGDIRMAAVNAINGVISANPAGVTKIKLRNETFKAAGQGAVANAIIEAFFGSDDDLNSIIGDFGYVVKQSMVVPG